MKPRVSPPEGGAPESSRTPDLTPDPAVSRRSELEFDKLEHEIAKLQAEKRAIDENLSRKSQYLEMLKAVTGLAGVLTAIAALAGLWVSNSHWQDESRRSREAAAQQNLSHVLEELSAPVTTRQLAAIASLQPYLSERDSVRQRQILPVLASLLAVEEKPVVRSSILASFAHLSSDKIDRHLLDETLTQLAENSRGLVTEGDLWNTRRTSHLQSVPPASVEARAISTGFAIITLIRKGANSPNLSGIYCTQCDWRGLDLRGYHFDNAILYLSDFSRALLARANFDGAELEATLFVSSDLNHAVLTAPSSAQNTAHESSFMTRESHRGGNPQVIYRSPVFDCADLRGAQFAGRAIFGFISEKAAGFGPESLVLFPSSFVAARLDSADFRNARMFGTRDADEPLPFNEGEGQEVTRTPQPQPFEYGISRTGAVLDTTIYRSSLEELELSFAHSNWKSALLPPGIAEWLASHSYVNVVSNCTPSPSAH
jgi:uncharacterized protein YjbI with pentapeptide repeats